MYQVLEYHQAPCHQETTFIMENTLSLPRSSIQSRAEKLPQSERFSLWFSLLGSIVEYYDYALYGFSAAILAHVFFPEQNSTIALLKVYGLFALGSCSKPLGSLIMGKIGDSQGRKAALQWSMLGIAIPTTVIALLPSYETWGLTSAIVLVVCRILQGLFLSGEIDGVRIFIYESFLQKRPCLANCLVNFSCYIGILIASLAASIAGRFPSPHTWRIPFLIGGAFGVIVWFGRHALIESKAFEGYPQDSTHSKALLPRFQRYWRPFLGTIFICGAAGGIYHLLFVFSVTYLPHTLRIVSSPQAQTLGTFALSTHMACLILSALASDHYSPQRVMRMALFTFPVILLSAILFFMWGGPIIYSFLILSAAAAFLVEPGFNLILPAFGVLERYRYMSLGHSLGSLIFSGTAPAISLFFMHTLNHHAMPIMHLCLLWGVLAIGVYCIVRARS